MEAALEQVSAPAFAEVDVTCVSSMRFADALSKTRFRLRYCDEVNVVRHQAPGQVANAEPLTLLADLTEILLPILPREEDIHPADATLDNVVRKAWDDHSRYAGHGLV